MSQEDGAIKAEGIHILASGGIDLAGSGEHGTLGLCFGGGDDVWNAHQLQQLLALGIVLPGDSHGSSRELFNILSGASLLGLLEILVRFGLALESLSKLTGLELRGRAVENIEGLDAVVDHAQGAVEHAHEMGGGVARLIRQLLAVGPDRDEKTVDAHGAEARR